MPVPLATCSPPFRRVSEASAFSDHTPRAQNRAQALGGGLAAIAQGGEIVVAEATLARLGPDVAAEDLGVRELKNVETPLRLFRLQ